MYETISEAIEQVETPVSRTKILFVTFKEFKMQSKSIGLTVLKSIISIEMPIFSKYFWAINLFCKSKSECLQPQIQRFYTSYNKQGTQHNVA